MARDTTVLVDQDAAGLDSEDTSSDAPIRHPFDPTKIRVETKSRQMDSLIKRIKDDAIDLAPDFQRGDVWRQTAQSRLIESMLIKIPLPAFYMDASDDDLWLVVDGRQRLTAVKKFVVDQEIVLKDLEFLTQFEGKKFAELPRSFQRRIEETDVTLYLIQPGTPPRVKFDIFRRINTGGEPLSPQEIRHALHQGQVIGFLKTLATSQEFLNATGGGVSPKRMADLECVLRFLAFRMFPPKEYNDNDLDGFLSHAMLLANDLGKDVLNEHGKCFKQAMTCASKIFGDQAFRKRYEMGAGFRYQINKALFEAWSVNLSMLDSSQKSTLVKKASSLNQRFIELMNSDAQFEKAISQGTGSIKNVQYRFGKIADIINEVLQ